MKAKPILMSTPMVRALLDGRKTQTRRLLSPDNIRLLRGGVTDPIVSYKPDKDHLLKALDAPQNIRLIEGLLSWHQYPEYREDEPAGPCIRSWMARLKYVVGNVLYVRENVTRFDKGTCDQHIWYRAGGNGREHDDAGYSWDAARTLGRSDGEWPANLEGPGGGKSYQAPSIHMPRWASRITLEVTEVRVQRLQDISEEDAKAEGAHDAGPCDHPRHECHEIGCFGPDYRYRGGFAEIWWAINGRESWDANPWIIALTFTVHKMNVDAYLAERKAA